MIRGQKMPFKNTKQIKPIPTRLHNRFDFEVRDGQTGEIKQRAYAENIILDSWWTRVFTPAVANSHIHVGTGTGTLSADRTSLFTFLAAKATSVVEYTGNKSEGWVAVKKSAQWSELENQNTAWREVGIAYGTSDSNLVTHALIKDMNGNPVTINKGTTDIITVYATVYFYFQPNADNTAEIVFPVNFERASTLSLLILWALGLSSSIETYGAALYGNRKRTQGYVHGAYDTAYWFSNTITKTMTAATKTLVITFPRLAAADGNVATGIGSFITCPNYISGSSPWFAGIWAKVPSTWFPYSSITAESIGTGDGSNLDFATDFPFVKNDGSFVLKKNGDVVDPADYTVDFEIPNQKYLEYYFNLIDWSDYTAAPGQPQSSGGGQNGSWCIFENPFYASYGINKVKLAYCALYTSDNGTDWTKILENIGGSETQYTVTVGHENKRYWKYVANGGTPDYYCRYFECTALNAKKNVHFASGKAPDLGDTITADYRSLIVAKDANHVFDLSVTLVFQEKTT